MKENEDVVIYYNQDKPTNYVTIDTNSIKHRPDQDKSKPVVINYWVGRLTADAKKSGKWNVTAGSNLSKSVWVASVEEAVTIAKKEKYTEKA